MKLLITGACGHIGSHLVKNIYKIKKIKEVILVDNFNTQRFSTLFNLNKKIKEIIDRIEEIKFLIRILLVINSKRPR